MYVHMFLFSLIIYIEITEEEKLIKERPAGTSEPLDLNLFIFNLIDSCCFIYEEKERN